MKRLTRPPPGASPEQAKRHYLAFLHEAQQALAAQRRERDPDTFRREIGEIARRTDDAEMVELIREVQRGTRSRFDLYRNRAYQQEVRSMWQEEVGRLRSQGIDLPALMRERLAEAGLDNWRAPGEDQE